MLLIAPSGNALTLAAPKRLALGTRRPLSSTSVRLEPAPRRFTFEPPEEVDAILLSLVDRVTRR